MVSSAPRSNKSAIDPNILKKVRRLEVRVRRLVNTLFVGEYHALFKGQGIEFSDVREYQPGDDIRIIDWNVTARLGFPYVKRFVEERDLTVILMVDISSSSLFSTKERTKRDLAAEICALLAFAAIRNNDKVGLVTFTDHVERFIPPRKGSEHALRVVRELLFGTATSKTTNIANALRFISRLIKRKSVIFLVSDFIDQGYEAVLRVAGKRHEVIAIAIEDPREVELPPVGILALKDAETGEIALVDTSDKSVREQFGRDSRAAREERDRLLHSIDVPVIKVSTDKSYVEPLMRHFATRGRGRR
ncbi:MAG: DUF58 domain-containing protein [Dehalococcoidia bacterium]|nr:DUF58 domain-containing protein [Dehalococcoidia bacterium]